MVNEIRIPGVRPRDPLGFMTRTCPECGGELVLDEQLCSAICTRCGHLDDPEQTLLADHVDHSNTNHHVHGRKWYQSKEDRSKKNMASQ